MVFKKIQTAALLILSSLMITNATLCSYTAKSKYQNLINQYPDFKDEFDVMSKYSLPVWYTDRDAGALSSVKDTLQNCDQSTSVIIVYGLPNKDCSAGESSGGSNKNTNDYVKFVTDLHNQVSDKEIIYILEPDALSLSVKNKCGLQNNYIENIKTALNILSQNKNAKIYLDVGFWIVIYDDQQIKDFLSVVNQVDPEKKVKGFSLNLSNYRSKEESINSCKKVRDISGIDYKCIIDTSRNANGPNAIDTWCNLDSAGIGELPTDNTGVSFIDYFLWIKPAIEVDGYCQGSPGSYQSSAAAGGVDTGYFQKLWDQGIMKNLPKDTQNDQPNSTSQGDQPSMTPQPSQGDQRTQDPEFDQPSTTPEPTLNLRCVTH
jgi:hypothetical protein